MLCFINCRSTLYRALRISAFSDSGAGGRGRSRRDDGVCLTTLDPLAGPKGGVLRQAPSRLRGAAESRHDAGPIQGGVLKKNVSLRPEIDKQSWENYENKPSHRQKAHHRLCGGNRGGGVVWDESVVWEGVAGERGAGDGDAVFPVWDRGGHSGFVDGVQEGEFPGGEARAGASGAAGTAFRGEQHYAFLFV